MHPEDPEYPGHLSSSQNMSLAGAGDGIQDNDDHGLIDPTQVIVEVKQSCVPYRYVTAILASLGFLTAQGARSSFNIALVAMVNDTTEDGLNTTLSHCPISKSSANHTQPMSQGEFAWDGAIQSQLLSGFFYGYVVTQFPGGYLAERFGSTLVFGLNILIPSIMLLLHPILARWDYRALFVIRVIMGICQGPLYPANQALWGKWSPPLERSRLITLSTAGDSLGVMMSMFLTGYLCSLPDLGGWPLPFYVWGAAGCVWFVIWTILAADAPRKSRMISPSELQYIQETTGQLDTRPYTQPPWCAILSSSAFWAVVIYLVCDGIGYCMIFTELPVYMKVVLHFDISQEGKLAALPFIASLPFALLSGPLADHLLTKGYLSTTNVRKLATIIGQGSTAVAMVCVGLADCDHVMVIVLLVVGNGLKGLTAAGVSVVTLDMAPQYAGSLLGMTNVVHNIGGFLSPTIVGSITHNQGNSSRWQLVFFLTAATYAFGIMVFLLFGSAELQPWAAIPPDPDSDPEDHSQPDPEEANGDTGPLIIR